MFKSLRWSILLLGAVGLGAALLTAAQGYWSQSRMDHSAEKVFTAKDVVADILPPPMYLIELRLVLSQAIEGSINSAAAKTQFERLVSEYNDRVQYWTKNPPYGLEKQLLGNQHAAAQRFITAAQSQIINPLLAGDTATAKNNLPQVHALYLEHRQGVNETVTTGTEFGNQATTAFASIHNSSAATALSVLAAATLLVIVFGQLVLRNSQQQLGGEPSAANFIVQKVATGDLAVPIDLQPGDRSSLMAQLKYMQDNLIKVVSNVRQGSQRVASTSEQISQGNVDLSNRTDSQARSLQESAASMEQLAATVRQNADNAKQANQLAVGATTVAVKGGEVVSQVVDTMKGINESSKKITDIVSVIDGIAFQTNILALNAAVEAARAGEQGRGFAVVASEVRSLAQRSAEAAKEIRELILASVSRVEQGTVLVDQAGITMTEIVTAIKRVTDIMSEISLASTEQSAAVATVSESVMKMDEATQQNAALVEESAAAAKNLEVQARELVHTVAIFKFNEHSLQRASTNHTPTLAKATHTKPLTTPKVTKSAPAPTDNKTPVEKTVQQNIPRLESKTGTDDWSTF